MVADGYCGSCWFPRNFLSLPPELRDHIYRLYFEDPIHRPKKAPIEPPFCCVSKQLRHESLPIYYAVYVLPIQTFIRCSFYGQVWLRTEKWYHNITFSKLRHIERFVFNFALIDRYTGERVPIEFHLGLFPRSGSYTIKQVFALSWFRSPHRMGDPADFEELIAVIRGHLESTLNHLLTDPGIGNFTARHIDRLITIDPDSLPLQTID